MNQKALHLQQDLPIVTDWRALLTGNVPLLDVRAPVEFKAGAFPNAQNAPLMNDAERAAIGKCYKQAGQGAAIALGLKLVSGSLKEARVAAWADFANQYPQGALYCFRGGLRSKIAQQWLYEQTGIYYPRVHGGYKALRRSLLNQLQQFAATFQPTILSGRTGSGKTRLLTPFQQQIDLEDLANHRGSAFGPQVTPQPAQIDFENALAIQLLRYEQAGVKRLLFEDESQYIGSLHVPTEVFSALKTAPLVVLETDTETRIQISYQEYVVDMLAAFQQLYADESTALTAFSEYLLGSLYKIRKRLGGVRYAELHTLMQQALAKQKANGDLQAHRAWVRRVLLEYYDPMYDYQLSQKQARLQFRGDAQAVRAYLAEQGIC